MLFRSPVFKNPREEIEFEVKKAVIQDLNVDSLKGETGDVDDAGTAALKKNNSPLFHAIDAVSTDPKKAGINAETAAGLQIARETLDRSGIDENAAKQMAAIGAKTGGIHGVSADGELIAQYGEKRRIPVTLDQIPPEMVKAFIATEDSRFYEHHGVDPVGIFRAASVALFSGHASQGASTITQQLARNFFLSPERTLMRKIKEVFLAIRIEQLLTKDEILELYLNKIYLGYRAYGVGAAAQVYFGKTVDQLTLNEMAVIAGLPKAPSTFNPLYSMDRAVARRPMATPARAVRAT